MKLSVEVDLNGLMHVLVCKAEETGYTQTLKTKEFELPAFTKTVAVKKATMQSAMCWNLVGLGERGRGVKYYASGI